MKTNTFSAWLQQALQLAFKAPLLWAGCCVFIGAVLVIGHVSFALGIFTAVTCLLSAVGIAKYIDMQGSVGFFWAIGKSLPLAILAATTIVFCWFVFMAGANILNGEPEKIGRFFFNWELTTENLNTKSARELANWLYSYANIALIFVLLMLNTFASWFSFQLMLFKGYSWSRAKAQSDSVVAVNKSAIYKLLGFIFLEAVLCSSVTPWLSPVLFMLTSTLMFVSYKNLFEKTSST
ncbi:MAG: hypothetical protein ABL925_01445 [Methylococcales bacterium]